MTSGPVNWVKARANCTLEDNLSVIISQVEKDVDTFNKLRSDKRGTRHFSSSFDDGEFIIKRMIEVTDHRGMYVVEDDKYKSDIVVVRCAQTAISVCRNSRMNFTINPRWNPDSQECDMLVRGDAYPVWRISEMILGDFLFEDA